MKEVVSASIAKRWRTGFGSVDDNRINEDNNIDYNNNIDSNNIIDNKYNKN